MLKAPKVETECTADVIDITLKVVGVHCNVMVDGKPPEGLRPYAFDIRARVPDLTTVVVHGFVLDEQGKIVPDGFGGVMCVMREYQMRKLVINGVVAFEWPNKGEA
jgi:hypothetical protein